jgi:hypothetical protein
MAGCEIAVSLGFHCMNEIRTRVVVGPDHRISGTAPAEVPEGEHEVTITLGRRPDREQAAQPLVPDDLPRHDLGPWPGGLSLRREDIYGDDGR